MIPPHGTRPRRTGAIAALRSLRTELHNPEISYVGGLSVRQKWPQGRSGCHSSLPS